MIGGVVIGIIEDISMCAQAVRYGHSLHELNVRFPIMIHFVHGPHQFELNFRKIIALNERTPQVMSTSELWYRMAHGPASPTV